MFQTIAAGIVADELPKDLISKFLEAVKESENRVFQVAERAPLPHTSPTKSAVSTDHEMND